MSNRHHVINIKMSYEDVDKELEINRHEKVIPDPILVTEDNNAAELRIHSSRTKLDTPVVSQKVKPR